MAKWLSDAIFYEIYPQSFNDTNGDGIGDLQGIIEKLDYIKGLGCNALWLNPCFDSPFMDAGYDVRDYKKVAPRYGTNADLIELFDTAHKKGMHVLLDLVAGHTSEQHPWFLASRKASPNEYSDRFIWTDNWFTAPDGLKGVAGMAERDGVYVVNFFNSQPALNYGFLHPDRSWQKPIDDPACRATVDALYDVMCFWMGQGCDGFRVDMADSLVKNDDENKSGTCSIWTDIRRRMESDFPEAVLVAEWNNPKLSLPAGFHMDFMLNWGGNGYDRLLRDEGSEKSEPIFAQNSKRSITDFFDDYLPKYEYTKDIGYYCLITGNHDTTRVSRTLTPQELKLAYAFLFTMPGVPFIYYGDEIGMHYMEGLVSKEGGYGRTGSRTPMQWDLSENMGFSDATAERLYLPVETDDKAPNVASMEKANDSLLNHVRELLSLRKSLPELTENNNFRLIFARKYERAFIYCRGNLMFVCNPDGAHQTINAYDLIGKVNYLKAQPIYIFGDVDLTDAGIEADASSFGIFRLTGN